MKIYMFAIMMVTTSVFAQTTYYSDSNGMPIGSAQRSGNTTY